MRIKDTKHLGNAITAVNFVETEEGLWEIHIYVKGKEEVIVVTKHEPVDEKRNWKNIDTALHAAKEFFGTETPQLSIILWKTRT